MKALALADLEGADGDLGGLALDSPAAAAKHGPEAEAIAYDIQLVHDLFTNYLEAAAILDIDAAFRERISDHCPVSVRIDPR